MNMLTALLLIGGLVFFTGGAIGILRFPDFYSRLHPAGKLDTAGQLLALSVYARYREEGASFVPSYLELLAAGGSKWHPE